jgi:hypothetical protein
MLLAFLGQSVSASVIACEMSEASMSDASISEMNHTTKSTGSQQHAHHEMLGLNVEQNMQHANDSAMAMSDCCDENGTCFMSGCVTASTNGLYSIQPLLSLPMSKLSTTSQSTKQQVLSLYRPPISI